MFSPSRVIARLAGYFPSDHSPPTRREIAIANAFKGILQEALNGDIDFEEVEEFQASVDEVENVVWTPEDDNGCDHIDDPSEKAIVRDGRTITSSMLSKAAEYYRSKATKSRPLGSMSNRFRWIKSKVHLQLVREFGRTNEMRENRVLVFTQLAAAVREKCMDALQKGLPLSYSALRHMVLTVNNKCGFVDDFKASKKWIWKFVRECGLRSRRVTSFVTSRNLRSRREIEDAAAAFVSNVRTEMAKYPLSVFCNMYQSGVNREVVSQRTLASVGVRQVHRMVQSSSSLTHSYTVVPVLYADGTLGEKLFVALPEPQGGFPQSGHWLAPNLCVVAGTTHIMRKGHVPSLISSCIMARSEPTVIIALVDSWPGFRDHANVLSGVTASRSLKVMTMPPGATALCQPLDVYFLWLFKRYIRRIHESVLHIKPEFNCFSRDNTLKVLSQIYRQFCTPMFRECFQYAWFAAGYVDTRPGPFITPTDFAFNQPVDDACQGKENCSDHAFVRCCWCEKSPCFVCFDVQYHNCWQVKRGRGKTACSNCIIGESHPGPSPANPLPK